MGTVLRNVQLSQLSDQAKDELALLISECKIVAFPEQDFLDAGPEALQKFMDYFGKRNYHPVCESPWIARLPCYPSRLQEAGTRRVLQPKVNVVSLAPRRQLRNAASGYVMLGLLDGPKVGGDTVFAATDEAYRNSSTESK
ncbi:hypothetical protein B0H13DRAFT_1878983 [Mycena leptocephala]|nr:hypothetical protein B0H13DRAFT_1878983 [Mycena leptocephala]